MRQRSVNIRGFIIIIEIISEKAARFKITARLSRLFNRFSSSLNNMVVEVFRSDGKVISRYA